MLTRMIRSTPRLPLDLATMRALNRNLCHYYDDWAGSLPSNTPRAAAIKNFFTKSEPIGMSNNYGQNRPAFQETPEDVENLTQEFNESHTFSEIRFISCAIATTFRVRHRSSIIEERFFPVRELGGKIYAKHLQSGEMRRVRDENLDRFDEFPKTPLYRQYLEPAGKKRYARIQRSEREYGGRHKGALGVMLNLAKCRRSYEDVFVPVADDDERRDPEARDGARGHAGGEPRFPSEDPANGMNPGQGFGDAGQGPRASRVRTHDEFPVGFMRNIGNIQTNSPLPYLKPILQAINDEVRHEELRDCCWNPHSQIYGEYWHLQNDVTKDNPLAKGELTAIFAGAHFPSTSPNGQKCRRLIEAVRARGPPYSVYESKLDVAGDHIGLRMEPTIHIDLDCLAPECQTGAYIYTDILMQACGAWATPINCARIIDGMVIFKPDVFPACILATTFPLQATMDAMYTAPRTVVALSRQDERQGAPPKVRIPVTQIELMADLERLMSWAGSGDNRVLPNLHLRQLFVFDGLDHFTWPMFAKSLELHLDDDGSPDLRMDVFPQTPNLTTLSSASAAILYRYGFMAAEV